MITLKGEIDGAFFHISNEKVCFQIEEEPLNRKFFIVGIWYP